MSSYKSELYHESFTSTQSLKIPKYALLLRAKSDASNISILAGKVILINLLNTSHFYILAFRVIFMFQLC